MISLICSSIRPEDAERLEKNIRETIGENVPFEFIAHDNREDKLGLCKLYNMCAEKAQFDYLCFLHEDVQFDTQNWGEKIIHKLSELSCGVVGFAGSDIKIKESKGWRVDKANAHTYYIQHYKHRDKKNKSRFLNVSYKRYAPVVTLDGMALFVRKDVWQEIRFDQDTFTGFHCYDIDFSLAVAQHYDNYVCTDILVEHFSEGSFNSDWQAEQSKFNAKWESEVPFYTHDFRKLSSEDQIYISRYLDLKFTLKFTEGKSLSKVYRFIGEYPTKLKSWGLISMYVFYKYFYTNKKMITVQNP